MKKTAAITLALVFVGALAFTGCRKNYTCDCTASGQTYHYDLVKEKKKTAQSTCDLEQTDWKMVDPAATCTLK